jgi:serine/threonine-protein kinase RsbW
MHGNHADPEKRVEIEISCKERELKIKITDEGSGFIPKKLPDPTVPENLESLNGRGVFLMSKLADKIKFSKKGNSVTMIFKNVVD